VAAHAPNLRLAVCHSVPAWILSQELAAAEGGSLETAPLAAPLAALERLDLRLFCAE
jgi:hypothetical protein